VTGPVSAPNGPLSTDKASEPDEIAGNLADAVWRTATASPDAFALVAAEETVTWRELDERVDGCAAGLRALALAAGARVAIALPNVVEFAVAFFGTLRAGLVAVPVNPAYTARELGHLLGDSGASVLVATGAVIERVPTFGGHRFVVGTPAGTGRPFAELVIPSGPVEAGTHGEELAVLLYTSGTAGAPRGAMLSHRALIANHHQVSRVSPPIIEPGDVVLLAPPLFHALGLNSGLGAVAWHGATGVLVERFDPSETLRLITEHHVSVITAVPQMYLAWSFLPDLDEALASVRVAVSGAAPLDPATAHQFLDTTRHPVFEGYGLTETAPVVATALVSPVPKIGSIGRPLPGIEVRLVGTDGTTIAEVSSAGLVGGGVDDFDDDAGGVPGTDPGELVVRGANLFSGYWPDGAGGPDPQGWWPTGDVAYADADGDLFLVDRLGELILVSGFNVYPHEVELVLAAHPGVAEAAVVGVAHPYTGESVKAFVVPVDGMAVSAEDLIAHCELNLARFKCPAVVQFVTELPHSATGKVRKGTLREDG
jgi:long-chain acyl-CoA synthetase